MGNVARCLPLLSPIPSLAHHHLAELVKVHGAGAVLVDLLDDPVQVLRGQARVELGDDLPVALRDRGGFELCLVWFLNTN